MQKIILLSLICLTLVFCDLEDKNSNVRNWLQIRSARIPDLKKAVEAYNFDTDQRNEVQNYLQKVLILTLDFLILFLGSLQLETEIRLRCM